MSSPTGAARSQIDHGAVCLLLTGAPGAGKSTVSRMVAHALSRSAVIEDFFVSTLVVGGRVWALGEPQDEAARQVDLTIRNVCALARNFADAGFTPVIDSVVADRPGLDTFREQLGDRLRLVVLDPGTDACVGRNVTRSAHQQFFFDGYTALRASMQAGFGDRGWWLDTSRLTADETSALILDQGYERARLTART